ncbi:MAG: hypothetical protein AB7T38_16465 [Nitrospirales bacterium]
MGEIVEGAIALMGLITALMVALTTLLSGEGGNAGKGDTSYHYPRTIRPSGGRMTA